MNSRKQTLLLIAFCAAIYAWVPLGLFVVKSAVLTMVVYWLLCGCGWVILRSKLAIGFSAKQAGAALLALSGGFIFTYLLMNFALQLLPTLAIPAIATRPLLGLGMNAQSYIPLAIIFGIFNPITEEAFWRGRVMPSLLRATVPGAVLLQAILFAGFHVMPLWLIFLPPGLPLTVVFVGGVIFGIAALWSRGLLVPWALHAGVNAYLLIWFARFMLAGSQ